MDNNINKERDEVISFFDGYYNDYIKDCSDIMFAKVNEGLTDIFDKYGMTSLNDAYRLFAYTSLKVLHASFTNQISQEESIESNKKAMTIVDNLIQEYKDKKSGKEIVFTMPLIMMDILAFKEYEHEKNAELENGVKEDE